MSEWERAKPDDKEIGVISLLLSDDEILEDMPILLEDMPILCLARRVSNNGNIVRCLKPEWEHEIRPIDRVLWNATDIHVLIGNPKSIPHPFEKSAKL